MKVPLNLVKAEADRIANTRQCGECTACCVLPRISPEEDDGFPEGKPGYHPCSHLCASGCGIYDNRPKLCRNYQCLWRYGILGGDERRRPDKLGVMLTLDTHEKHIVFEAWELWDGALTDGSGKWLIDALSQKYGVMLRFYGVPASIAYVSHTSLELGRKLADASRDCPEALADWIEEKIANGQLDMPPCSSGDRDLKSLRRGEPVIRHYKKGGS